MIRASFYLAVSLAALPAHALDISGPATIQDGDTFRIGEQVIRLNGPSRASGAIVETGTRNWYLFEAGALGSSER